MASANNPAFYSLAPGVEAVRLSGGDVLFRSDHLEVRLEGASAALFHERVLPLLDGRREFAAVLEELPDLAADDLRDHLDGLTAARVLSRSAERRDALSPDREAPSPLALFLEQLGLGHRRLGAILADLNVAVFGLEAAGAHAAAQLARCGVGELRLIDPFPCAPGNLLFAPLYRRDALGKPRELALRDALTEAAENDAGAATVGKLRAGERETLDPAAVAALADGCDLLLSCFDHGFTAMHLWVNQASLALGIPALYSRLGGHRAEIGPLVLPGETACYLCYRMRAVACASDFEQAMSYEEHLDRQREPRLHARGALPALAPYAGGLLAQEALRQTLGLTLPMLAGKVHRYDSLRLQVETHPVLQRPDCSACQKKNRRRQPTASELISAPPAPAGDPLSASDLLVSARTGIVEHLAPFEKDPSEPARPWVYQAMLANNRFLVDEAEGNRGCSGKGMTLEQARRGALGEAVERYSGALWPADMVRIARRRELPGASLDPRSLVLYAAEQYPTLRYAPYDGENRVGWVEGRSLISGERLWLPALAVLMSYQVERPEEFLFPVTSNGLAAGPSLLEAVLRALCEVLERDAFLITWLQRLPATRIDPARHPDPEVTELVTSYRRRGVDSHLLALPTDHPCTVFMAVLETRADAGIDGPALCCGLGADLDPERAARGALLEAAQVRPALRRRLRRPEVRERVAELIADPKSVASLDDHDLLYADQAARPKFDFLLTRPIEAFSWSRGTPPAPRHQLERLLDHFRATGEEVVYVDLTPEDMRALSLYTARVVVTGFQPMHFGRDERRLGGERLFDLPEKLGLVERRRARDELNDDPHPLA